MTFLRSAQFWTSLIIGAVCVVLIMFLSYLAKKQKRSDLGKEKTPSNIGFFTATAKYVIVIFGAVTIMQINGINVTSLITGIGIVGIVVGFAVQDILKDLIMGMNIVWNDFFHTGDTVTYNGHEGQIVSFNLRVTKLRDSRTGGILTVSNRNISEIEKNTSFFYIDVPAPYEISASRMREVCRSICAAAGSLEAVSAAEFLGTQDFGDSAVLYRIMISCEPADKFQVRRDALGIIQDVFESESIDIPYTQIDVHFDKEVRL